MASSGSFSTNRGAYELNLRLDWKQLEQDIPNNRTKLRLSLYFVVPSAGFRGIGYTANKSGSIQGQTFRANGRWISTSGAHLLAQRDIWVPHNNDGTKTISLSASYDMGINWNGRWVGNVSISGNAQLNKIPRSSDLTSASITALQPYSDATLNISMNVKYNNYYHYVAIYDGNLWIWDSVYSRGSLPSSHVIPANIVRKMLERMENTPKKDFRLRLNTYSGNNRTGFIGSSWRNFSVEVHSSVQPSITSATHSEAVSQIAQKFGVYVQNKSKLNLNMSANAGYGSSIRSYKITANGTSYNKNSVTTTELINSGNQTITFEATDGRGRTATTTRTINVSPYSPPQVKRFDVARSLSNGQLSDQGTYVRADYSLSVSSVNGKNDKSYKIQYKKENQSSWQTINLSSYSYDPSTYQIIRSIDADYSYEFKIVVKDFFDEISVSQTVSSTFTLINFDAGKKGLAFGRVYDKSVGGRVQIDGHKAIYFSESEDW